MNADLLAKSISQIGNKSVIDQYKHTEGIMMGTLLKDLRQACKLLVCNPGFAVAALTVLAIGIATNSSALAFMVSSFIQ